MDVITSETPIPHIIQRLTKAGCPDITRQLDLSRCSEWRIPEGGQGDIYEGTLIDGRQVAIKTTRGDQSINLSSGDVSFKRAARELNTWFNLKHPNIAQLLGMATFRGYIAMVSPWVYPGNFYKYIQKYPEANRMSLCIQIANGLAYLHENKVVFGDMKAQNILIGADGIPKLTDFGLSVLGNSRILFSTTTNLGGGTGRWMAPELITSPQGRSYEADLYALGMTFIEIFTDNIPFPGIAGDMKVMFAVAYKNAIPDKPERLRVRSSRHDLWWKNLRSCWDRNPSSRPKASSWRTLDETFIERRCQELMRLLEHALLYGCTKEGSLKNLDTGEALSLSRSRIIFSTTSRPGAMQSSMHTLIKHISPAMGPRQYASDPSFVYSLQDWMHNALDTRVKLVRYWVKVNLGDFPLEYGPVRHLHNEIDKMASDIRQTLRLCARTCSECSLSCLLPHKLRHLQHNCGTHNKSVLKRTADTLNKMSNFFAQKASHGGAQTSVLLGLNDSTQMDYSPPEDSASYMYTCQKPCLVEALSRYWFNSDPIISHSCCQPSDHRGNHICQNHVSLVCKKPCYHSNCKRGCFRLITQVLRSEAVGYVEHSYHTCDECVSSKDLVQDLEREETTLDSYIDEYAAEIQKDFGMEASPPDEVINMLERIRINNCVASYASEWEDNAQCNCFI